MEPSSGREEVSSEETVVRCTRMTFGFVINRMWILVSRDLGSGKDTCSSMVAVRLSGGSL